ncbi:MAG: hypothetical protein ACPL3Q_07620, partial [Candidatus Ratteibacteria bacterium]
LEIWTDEIKVICPNCKKEVLRLQEASCLDWCKYAKQCVGDEIYNKYMKNKSMTIKEKLLKEIENFFGNEF